MRDDHGPFLATFRTNEYNEHIMADEELRDEEEEDRPRPRVVDKRISARAGADPGPPQPSAPDSAGLAAPPSAPGAPAAPAGPGAPAASGAASPAPTLGDTAAKAPSPPPSTSAPPGPAPSAPAGETSGPAPGDPDGERLWTPEQEAQAREVAQQIVQTPSVQWVVEAAANLANVAGIKIDMGAPEDAQLAIDALAALLNGVGHRLQGAEQPLRQVLAQLQLAFAQQVAPPPPQ